MRPEQDKTGLSNSQGFGNPMSVLWSGSASLFMLLLSPALVAYGGSTSILNWGPGILAVALGLLSLAGSRTNLGLLWWIYLAALLGGFGMLYFRADQSPDRAAATHTGSLMLVAASGCLIGILACPSRFRYLLLGLAIATIGNFACSVVQISQPEWSPVYPGRSSSFPSGFFAHYNYSASFCLISAGLLFAGFVKEKPVMKFLLVASGLCALATIPISLSRGGNFALGVVMTTAATLWLVKSLGRGRSTWFVWPSLALFVLIIISIVGYVVPMIGRDTGSTGFYQDGGRIGFWNAALNIAATHPLTGGGAGCFAWEVYQVMDGLGSDPVMVHNEALQLAVEFGYPTLIGFIILVSIPMLWAMMRFVSGTGSSSSILLCLGLLGFLVQSNFSFVFHTVPGIFFGALTLGALCREIGLRANATNTSTTDAITRQSLRAVRILCGSCRTGQPMALEKLIALLRHMDDEELSRSVFRLSYWSKTGDEERLAEALAGIERMAARKAGAPMNVRKKSTSACTAHKMPWLATVLVVLMALPNALEGYRLSRVFVDCWTPLYRPDSLALDERFRSMLVLAEYHEGLGLDRIILSTALECMDQSETQEQYQQWAMTYSTRLLNALPSWRTDPAAALLCAEILSWTADVNGTLELYERAVCLQGKNESLFRSHSLKGQYLYELSLSAGSNGYTEQQLMYARQALECFAKADQQMKLANRSVSPKIATMSKACMQLTGNGT